VHHLLKRGESGQWTARGIDTVALIAIVNGEPEDSLNDVGLCRLPQNVLHILRLLLWRNGVIRLYARFGGPTHFCHPDRFVRKAVLGRYGMHSLPPEIK